MWLDADDVIKEEMLPEFLDAKDKMEGIPDVVMIPYETGFDEQGNCNFSYERERIIRRSLKLKFYGRVHEVIAPVGTIVHWDLAIQHKKEVHRYSDRNLKIYRKMEHEGIPFRTRDCYYYARELFYHSIYEESEKWFLRVISSEDAWPPDCVEACLFLSQISSKRGDVTLSIQHLLNAIRVDIPRASVCVALGNIYREEEEYIRAVFWYKAALSLETPKTGFIDQIGRAHV